VRSSAAAWQRVDGEMVLMQAEACELLGLNRVGGRAWELMDGEHSVDQIAAAIAAEFAAEPATVVRDVDGFVDELLAAKLVELKPH
jgi:hypothetical protein